MSVTTHPDEPPRVFVVNEPTSREGERKFDLEPALAFGNLVHALRAGRLPDDSRHVVSELRRSLAGFRDTDYLLLCGSPIAIGCAVAVATQVTGGSVRLLRWHGRLRRYDVVTVDLADDREGDDAQDDATLDVDLATGEPVSA